ncbi:MAG: hypothetical protein EOO60_08300, partial [Hymenobacter sp.]
MNTPTNLNNNWLRLLPGLGLVLLSAGAAQAQVSTAANPITWTGAVNTLYTNPLNWSFNRAPNQTDFVRIPAVARQPTLDVANGIGVAGTLTIDAGASLMLLAQGELDLYGDMVANGSFGGAGLLSIRSITAVGATAPTLTTHTITSANTISINDVETMANAPTTWSAPVRLTRSLTVASNLTPTITNALTLLSTATSTAFIVNNGGIVNGPATVQRYIDNSVNAGVGYRHYSTPVSGNTVNDLATTTFTPNFNTAYNEGSFAPGTRPFPTVFLYDQANVAID